VGDLGFTLMGLYGAANVVTWIIGLIVAAFSKPIDPVELERTSMRSLLWPSDDQPVLLLIRKLQHAHQANEADP
jgi:hypothetical protein